MNTTAAYASEALVGPPSYPISVREFINAYSHSPVVIGHDDRATVWIELPESERRAIQDECNVSDLQSSLNITLSNPFEYSFLVQSHDNNIETIRAASTSNDQMPKNSKSKKRKHTGLSTEEVAQLEPEVLQLRNNLESIPLSCWPYPTDAAFFTRPQKNSDLNTLTKPKKSRGSSLEQTCPLPTVGEEAVLVVSVYNRLSWGNHLARSSQHVVLASQTIGDLYDVIPCPSNGLPPEIVEDGRTVGYDSDEVAQHRGAVVCIEGVTYGDGQAEEDYSDKLIQQMELLPERKRTRMAKGVCMHDQRFADLSLRVNQAYWLLHQGNCEHFLVVDRIRMLHPDDPTDGYPLTLHITPPILDLCMACARVPAVLSIVGDMRLGQSPFKICRPCWTLFGEPDAHEDVVVIPLPKHEHGW